METDIYHQDDEPIAADDQEYRRLYGHAASLYAAEEIDAWQMACAEGIIATTPSGDPSVRRGGGV